MVVIIDAETLLFRSPENSPWVQRFDVPRTKVPPSYRGLTEVAYIKVKSATVEVEFSVFWHDPNFNDFKIWWRVEYADFGSDKYYIRNWQWHKNNDIETIRFSARIDYLRILCQQEIAYSEGSSKTFEYIQGTIVEIQDE